MRIEGPKAPANSQIPSSFTASRVSPGIGATPSSITSFPCEQDENGDPTSVYSMMGTSLSFAWQVFAGVCLFAWDGFIWLLTWIFPCLASEETLPEGIKPDPQFRPEDGSSFVNAPAEFQCFFEKFGRLSSQTEGEIRHLLQHLNESWTSRLLFQRGAMGKLGKEIESKVHPLCHLAYILITSGAQDNPGPRKHLEGVQRQSLRWQPWCEEFGAAIKRFNGKEGEPDLNTLFTGFCQFTGVKEDQLRPIYERALCAEGDGQKEWCHFFSTLLSAEMKPNYDFKAPANDILATLPIYVTTPLPDAAKTEIRRIFHGTAKWSPGGNPPMTIALLHKAFDTFNSTTKNIHPLVFLSFIVSDSETEISFKLIEKQMAPIKEAFFRRLANLFAEQSITYPISQDDLTEFFHRRFTGQVAIPSPFNCLETSTITASHWQIVIQKLLRHAYAGNLRAMPDIQPTA